MQDNLILYIFLILIILALVMLANRLKIAYPIVLVLGGLLCSFISALSHVDIEPDLVFFIFLPPLLYEAAWQVSWKEFWKWRRVITGFAFPIVILTSCAIALVSSTFIPGFTLALGFLLGGIISPPDAVSATTIMRRLDVPKAMMSIIEGESLLNDASSLIVFRFAAIAVITGQFHLGEASLTFLLVVVMGILIGVAVAFFFYAVHRWLPTTPSIETVLTLVTPYCMYYAAEHFHFSGVLAVVSGGLLLSHKRQNLLSYRSRVQAVNVWSNLAFVLNGLVFLLIGLQLPAISQNLGDVSLKQAIGYGLAISLALIVTRLLCTFGAVLFTKFMSHFITVADANPGWKAPLISGWAGMRGVVSLAAALSIPLTINSDQPFPYRNLILFITFIVILVTLVLQGLTLPWLIRVVNVDDKYRVFEDAEQERIIRKKLAHYSLQHLEETLGTRPFSNERLNNLYARFQLDREAFDHEAEEATATGDGRLQEYQDVYLSTLERQRSILNHMNQRSEFDEDIIRKYLGLLDLEEMKVRELGQVGASEADI